MSDGILGRCSDSNPCSWPAIRWEMYGTGTEEKIPTPSSAPPKIIIYVQNLSMGSGGSGGGDVGGFNLQILVAPRN